MKISALFICLLLTLNVAQAHNHNKKKVPLKNEPQSQYQSTKNEASQKVISISADDFNYAGALTFSNDKAKKGKDKKTNDFKLYLNYAQTFDFLPVGMMGKATLRIQRINEDFNGKSTNSIFGLGAGVLHNLRSEDIKNSIFFGAQGGFERQVIDNGTDDESGLNLFFFLEGGKRFDIGDYSTANISYAPSVEFKYTRFGGDIRKEFFTSGTDFRINFLKFDILF